MFSSLAFDEKTIFYFVARWSSAQVLGLCISIGCCGLGLKEKDTCIIFMFDVCVK